ncbi:MAG: Gfo/Idh/MocA family oxidoreductase [Planctomycetota bacterium]|jgi:predicted dehydrogenase
MSEGPLRVAVVGVGAFGRHHARVYSELPEDLDAVSVAVPTIHHAAVAVPLLERGVACLVEKPFAPNLEQGEAMLAAAEKGGAALATGHIERFNPAVTAVADHPLKPRFLECHRIAPFSFRSADVGVVLDLMIHDLDLVLALAGGEPVRCEAVGVPVLTPHEDLANARVEFSNGCVANITASRVGTKTERKLRLFSSDAYMVLDFAEKKGWTYRKSPELTLEKVMAMKAGAASLADLKGAVFGDLLKVEPVQIEEHEPLKAELSSFLEAVRTGGRPVVTGEDGLRALKLALQVIESIREAHARFA